MKINNFWEKLPKPFFCLAPMADVTDIAFRQIIRKYGRPDVFWTEFVSADGLCSIGKEKLLIDLKFLKNEHPIIAQIFGSNPENMRKAASICRDLGFDGIDINMGCPDKTIEKQGSGANLIKNPLLAIEIIKKVKEGAYPLPVSVKTRIGYNKNEIDSWISLLLKQDIQALTIHLRTRKEKSLVPAHWELTKEIIDIRNSINKKILIIGNGDVKNLKDAKEKILKYGCDGIMLGRAIFGNPWLFANCQGSPLTIISKVTFDNKIQKKLKVVIEHTKLFEKKLGNKKNFNIMKKHFKAYVNGFEGAKELRIKLMNTKNAKEVEKFINDFLKKL